MDHQSPFIDESTPTLPVDSFVLENSKWAIKLLDGRILKNWYLIQLKPNSHRLAERNLNRQGFETFFPMQEVMNRKASRFVNDFRPLFPGYMFVSVKTELTPWREINSTKGVSRLLSFNGQLKPLPLPLISGLKLRCDPSGKMLPPKRLHRGDQVEILKGPFANFIATVEIIDTEQRIWVLMEFMGQETRIQVRPRSLHLISKLK